MLSNCQIYEMVFTLLIFLFPYVKVFGTMLLISFRSDCSNIIDFIQFRSERPKFLVPVSKPEQETPSFHLGPNSYPFRSIPAIPTHFNQYCCKCTFSAGMQICLSFHFILYIFLLSILRKQKLSNKW